MVIVPDRNILLTLNYDLRMYEGVILKLISNTDFEFHISYL
jgi:hypothetical protein